jgi:predicted O-methyltransferase YrrM
MTALPLSAAFMKIDAPFSLDARALIDHAAHDPHGGYHANYEDGFPSGSLWRVEGQFLYAIARALKPAKVLELGTWHGASATHLLQALHDNGMGALECVDSRAYGNVVIGGMIPDALRYRVAIHPITFEDMLDTALRQGHQYDLIFEDGMHDAEQVELVWRVAKRLLRLGGMIVSHDAMHPVAGFAVREGIAKAGYQSTNVLIAPADCGFALWRKWL